MPTSHHYQHQQEDRKKKNTPSHPTNRGILGDIIASVYEPGINKGLIVLMHASFLCLLASLVFMLWFTKGRNIHVLILSVIAISLYAIIIWFVTELRVTLEKQRQMELDQAKDD